MTTKHTVTDSRGQVHKRNSENRTYTHAVVIRLSSDATWSDHGRTPFARVEWASSLDLAKKNAAKWSAHHQCIGTEIVEAKVQGA